MEKYFQFPCCPGCPNENNFNSGSPAKKRKMNASCFGAYMKISYFDDLLGSNDDSIQSLIKSEGKDVWEELINQHMYRMIHLPSIERYDMGWDDPITLDKDFFDRYNHLNELFKRHFHCDVQLNEVIKYMRGFERNDLLKKEILQCSNISERKEAINRIMIWSDKHGLKPIQSNEINLWEKVNLTDLRINQDIIFNQSVQNIINILTQPCMFARRP